MDDTEAENSSKIAKDYECDEESDGDNSSKSSGTIVDCDFSIYKTTESLDEFSNEDEDGDISRDKASDGLHVPITEGSMDGSVDRNEDEEFSRSRTLDRNYPPTGKSSSEESEVHHEDLSEDKASDDGCDPVARDDTETPESEVNELSVKVVDADIEQDEQEPSISDINPENVDADIEQNDQEPSLSDINPENVDADIEQNDQEPSLSDENPENVEEARISVPPRQMKETIKRDSESESTEIDRSQDNLGPESSKVTFLSKESFTCMKQIVQNTQSVEKCTSVVDAPNTEASPILPTCLNSLPADKDKPSPMGRRTRKKRYNIRKNNNSETQKPMTLVPNDSEMTCSKSPNLPDKESCRVEVQSSKSTKNISVVSEPKNSDLDKAFIKEERPDEEDMYIENCVVSFGNSETSSRHSGSCMSSENKGKDVKGKHQMDPQLLSYLKLESNVKKNAKKNDKKIVRKNVKRIVEKKVKKIEKEPVKKTEKKPVKKIEKKSVKTTEKRIKTIEKRNVTTIEKKNVINLEKKNGKDKSKNKKKDEDAAPSEAKVDQKDVGLFSLSPQELFALMLEEKSDSEFECRNCQKVFTKREEAFSHMDNHHPFKCNVCNLKFVTLNFLETHKTSEHDEIFRCPYCGSVSTSSGGLHRHILVKHKGNPATFLNCAVCHICGKVFNENVGFKSHMEQIHNESVPLKVDQFNCPICSKVFRSNNGLKRHMDFHAGRVETCPFEGCSFRAQHKAHMGIHCNQVHLGINLLPCPFEGCPKKARRKVELDDHLNMVHYKIKNFTCENCGRQFTSKKYLTVHELIHTDSKPLACNFCEYRCRQRSALSWHMKKKHSDETEDKKEPAHKRFGSRYRPALKPGRKPKNEEEEPKKKRMKLATSYENTEERLVDEFLKNVIHSKQFTESVDSKRIAYPVHIGSEHLTNPLYRDSEQVTNPIHRGSEQVASPMHRGTDQVANPVDVATEHLTNPVHIGTEQVATHVDGK